MIVPGQVYVRVGSKRTTERKVIAVGLEHRPLLAKSRGGSSVTSGVLYLQNGRQHRATLEDFCRWAGIVPGKCSKYRSESGR